MNWIPKNIIPAPNVRKNRLLVCLEYGNGSQRVEISNWNERTQCFDSFSEDRITHWMPIPEFPAK